VASDAKRPFWLHQAAEYLIGVVLIASGLQSPTPVAPAVVGAVVLLSAAATRGPLSAFRLVPVRVHRWVDVAVIAFEVVGAIQPVVEVDSGTRIVMLGVALVHGFVWVQSSYVSRPSARERRIARASGPRRSVVAPEDRSSDIGRRAGRAVGVGVNMARRRAEQRRDRLDRAPRSDDGS